MAAVKHEAEHLSKLISNKIRGENCDEKNLEGRHEHTQNEL